MGDQLEQLVEAAAKTAAGMGKVAAGKADATPLQSDARTFRGIAAMLDGLSAEARRREQTAAQLRRILQRVAMLEVRGAQDLIAAGDWRGLVEELQAMAHDVLSGGGARQRER